MKFFQRITHLVWVFVAGISISCSMNKKTARECKANPTAVECAVVEGGDDPETETKKRKKHDDSDDASPTPTSTDSILILSAESWTGKVRGRKGVTVTLENTDGTTEDVTDAVYSSNTTTT